MHEAAPGTRLLRAGSLNVACTTAGRGFPLLLVHGFTGSSLDFEDHLAALAAHSRVITFDQRGHGASTNARPYTFDVLVADLIGVLDAQNIEVCDLLGHSLGGMVAMRAVLAHPERFRSVLLMDTAPEPVRLWSWRARWQVRRRVTRQGCMALFEDAQAATPTPPQQRGIDFVGADEHWRRRAWALEHLDPLAYLDLMDVLQRHEPVTARLQCLRCPVTILVGEYDLPFREPSARMADAIPGARLVIIPDAEHSPQVENAPAWRNAVLEHLRSVDPGP